MLDIEVVEKPTKTAEDIVTIDEFASHLRLSATLRNNSVMRQQMKDALVEVVSDLHGFSGSLNRMILPCTVTRYLRRFPGTNKPILIPYPDLIEIKAITTEDGSSPANVMPAFDYVVTRTLVPEVYARTSWPTVSERPRAISITYTAGYEEFPPLLKRLIKIKAAHAMENPEATINEPRQMAINRKVEFGVDMLINQLRIPLDYSDWGE